MSEQELKRNQFQADLLLGQRFEESVRSWLVANGNVVDYSPNYNYDMILYAKTGKMYKVECKYDRKYPETGNLFFEVSCSGMCSGVMKPHDIMVYGTPNLAPIAFNSDNLRWYLMHHWNNLKMHETAGDGGRVVGFTLTMETAIKNIKHNILQKHNKGR